MDLNVFTRLTKRLFFSCKIFTFFLSTSISSMAFDQYLCRFLGEDICSGVTCFKCFGSHKIFFLDRRTVLLWFRADIDVSVFLTLSLYNFMSVWRLLMLICCNGSRDSEVVSIAGEGFSAWSAIEMTYLVLSI